MENLSPILIFTYIRLDTLKKTVNALAANFHAADSDLIFISDGAKFKKDVQLVLGIRNYLQTIQGFKSVTIHESPINYGLSTSIILGVSKVLEKHPSVIVLEDDLIPSKNFLSYMNQALSYYQDNLNIISISGFSPLIRGLGANDVYFSFRSSSWGWACWADRWSLIDWSSDYCHEVNQNSILKSKFNDMGSDMTNMLKKYMEGYINSWAIHFSLYQFQHKLFSVHPAVSKINNVGFDNLSTNTKFNPSRFFTDLDQSELQEFQFKKQIHLDNKIIKQFIKNNSLKSRIFYKIVAYLS